MMKRSKAPSTRTVVIARAAAGLAALAVTALGAAGGCSSASTGESGGETSGSGGGESVAAADGCVSAAGGGCKCTLACDKASYELVCDGSTCKCTRDGASAGSFGQGGSCVVGGHDVAAATIFLGCLGAYQECR